MKLELLQHIVKDINSFYSDVKAESLVIELENKGILREDVIIESISAFTRPYRRDIIKSKKNVQGNKLLLELSRNGIYDSLPEGFFHNNDERSNISFRNKRRRRKDEEQKSRLFFSPIENELFNQRINIENKERSLIDNFYRSNNEFLLNFWDLKDYIRNRYVLKLLTILPHCHKIVGDFELTKQCLEKILEEKVDIKKTFENFEIDIEKKEENVLGMGFTTATEKATVATPLLLFKIGPISKDKLDSFYGTKEIDEFLTIFYSYFLPLEIKVETQFLSEPDEKFVLSDTSLPIMGVSTNL